MTWLSRRLAREIALRTLFQVEAGHNHAEEAMRYNAEELAASENASQYARTLVEGALAHLSEIDLLIRDRAIDWAFERLAGTDKAILRMAIYELQYERESVPVNVAISEAVELAKMYGDDASGRFVNGVLGAIIRSKQVSGSSTES